MKTRQIAHNDYPAARESIRSRVPVYEPCYIEDAPMYCRPYTNGFTESYGGPMMLLIMTMQTHIRIK